MPEVFKDGAFIETAYARVDDDAPLTGDGVALVSVSRWKQDAAKLLESAQRVGVFVEPADVDDDDLSSLTQAPVIAINFPKFTDGRGYSVARTLRDRLNFQGELLATGDVLIDQIPLMLRCGFGSYSVSHEPTVTALRSNAFKGIQHIYQSPSSGLRWQRRSRSKDGGKSGVSAS
ncbi:MAG: DUF934 domain-containing protein [Pseudomonadota bacterium]